MSLPLPFDLRRDGRQVGEWLLPHSADSDAWGAIPVPMAAFRNGEGPVALLVGGVHGDEYEGPIVLAELIRTLDAARLSGTVIVVPALNPSAARAGLRRSPLDGLDLARSFPGDGRGSPTLRLARRAVEELLPPADLVLDLHSGGASLDVVPCAMMRRSGDPTRDSATETALRSLGAPHCLAAAAGEGRSLVAAAGERGKLALAVELGGRGAVSPSALALGRRAVAGFLSTAGILDGETRPASGPLWRIARAGTVRAPDAGAFEPFRRPGDWVRSGAALGRLHVDGRPEREPVPLSAPVPGLLFAQRAQGMVERGGFVAGVASLDKA